MADTPDRPSPPSAPACPTAFKLQFDSCRQARIKQVDKYQKMTDPFIDGDRQVRLRVLGLRADADDGGGTGSARGSKQCV